MKIISCLILLRAHQRKNYLFIVIVSLFLLITACSPKAFNRVEASKKDVFYDIKVITIHTADGNVGPCEPSIDINSSDPSQVVAASVLNNIYVSSDTGRTWVKNKLTSSFGVYGDPVVRFTDGQSVLYAHLSNPENKAYNSDSFLDRIVVQKSLDGGYIWNNGSWSESNTRWDHDKQWLAVTEQGKVLMGWTAFDKYGSKRADDKSRILFSSSIDGGLSWTAAVTVSDIEGDCLDDDMTTEGGYPCEGVDGTTYMVWSFKEKIYFDRSEDGGKTWGADRAIGAQPKGWAFDIPGIGRCNGFPVLACDYSKGPNRGRLYVSWSDQHNGTNDTDVWLIFSDDKGKSWSSPVRVNNDAAGRHQFFSSMDVDAQTGFLYWVFYDRRKYADNMTDVYLAWSEDGGKTIYNQRIPDSPFTPNSDIFFGDYNDISAHNGIIRPVWTTFEDGKLHVKTALINRK
jgi:hypothetical protein